MIPVEDDWDYCVKTLPKVSRTFALNISVLRGPLHRSILTAYLFCRIVDTVEDAARLDPRIKIRLLQEFARIIEDPGHRRDALETWIRDIAMVDGAANDLDLLSQTRRVFNIFDSLPPLHREHITASVAAMARGMAYFQTKFDSAGLTLLKDLDELEEYCYFVAGVVGEMLCNLFLAALPGLPAASRETMKANAVSFGLGLQMTNISKDLVVDRSRGWSYIPHSLITASGLTVEEFGSGDSVEPSLRILEQLLGKTLGHLRDALEFTLAIPRREPRLRLFCIWPLWMAVETVAVLHNNRALLLSDDPVKISRQTVRKILRRTPLMCVSNTLLRGSFNRIVASRELENPSPFNLENLQERLRRIARENHSDNPLTIG